MASDEQSGLDVTRSSERGEGAAGVSRADLTGGVVAQLGRVGFADAVQVGQGGFGVVYRCAQVTLGRVVAVKVLTAGLAEDRLRFVREQQAMAQLTGHPNVVAVLAVGELAGEIPFLVMPFCGRGSVQQRMARLSLLPLEEVLRLGVKMAAALACAHRVGILHRDVKPANMLLTDYGEPALGDFGIARMGGGFQTQTGVFVGSPAFTAPEVIGGEPPTAAADVYGLGASLFAALTGHAPFERRVGEQVIAQFLRIVRDPAPDLGGYGIAADVAAVINAAMARNPHDRPTALQLGQQLQQLQADHGLPVDEMALHDTDASAPPPPAPRGAPRWGNLPAPLTALVSRNAEVVDLARLFAESRLVTVTGVGGIGKTTLAIHAARTMAPGFGDGVWLVELAELRDGALLANVTADALGLRDQGGRSMTEVLVDFLAPRRVLLVLDNCEHLIDDAAGLAQLLLRDCPGLHILATSREILDIDGETALPLAPLAVPEPDDDPTVRTLAGYDAVELFVQRARAATLGFALTQANAAAVARICTRLEGLPLALELAAARMRALSVDEIADGLSDRFRLLTRGGRGVSDRQHTLTACIDWSYRLCTPTEQRLWAQISVFGGSFELAAVAHVCAGQLTAAQCQDVLSTLVDKSILVRTSTDDGAARFKLLDTLRDYGMARIGSAEETQRLQRRHLECYQRLSAQAWAEWYSRQQVHWHSRLITELPNVREALQFALTHDPAAALEMATQMRQVWLARGMLGEARRWLELALSAYPIEPGAQRISALGAAALVALWQADVQTATARVGEARQLLEAVTDPVACGLIDWADGFASMLRGELQHAQTCFERAVTAPDFEVQATAMMLLGCALDISGEVERAQVWLERALALAEPRCESVMRSSALGLLGTGYLRLGDIARAEQSLREGLRLSQLIDNRWVGAQCLEALAWVAAANNDPHRAATLMAAASAASRASGAASPTFANAGGFHEECDHRTRERLSPAEFEAAWNEGDSLTFAEATALALTADA